MTTLILPPAPLLVTDNRQTPTNRDGSQAKINRQHKQHRARLAALKAAIPAPPAGWRAEAMELYARRPACGVERAVDFPAATAALTESGWIDDDTVRTIVAEQWRPVAQIHVHLRERIAP